MKNPIAKLLPKRFQKEVTVIPVVRLKGMIADGGGRFQQTLSLASAAGPLQKAFSIKGAPAVAISINSPGGSPVQSRLIYRRIRDLAKQYDKKVFVFTEDVAASGGYFIAVAGDEIIADPSSIIGSIGVISASFGFVEALEKLGIERRVYTAGENKSTLDPYKPARDEDIAHIKSLQLDIHEVFKDVVKERRADKLADNPDIFTGRFWAGGKALELGLVDHLGDMRSFLKARYGAKTEMKLISAQRGLFGRCSFGMNIDEAMTSSLSHGAANGMMNALEERGLWGRYGL